MTPGLRLLTGSKHFLDHCLAHLTLFLTLTQRLDKVWKR